MMLSLQQKQALVRPRAKSRRDWPTIKKRVRGVRRHYIRKGSLTDSIVVQLEATFCSRIYGTCRCTFKQADPILCEAGYPVVRWDISTLLVEPTEARCPLSGTGKPCPLREGTRDE